jgi:putative oxidoreductase
MNRIGPITHALLRIFAGLLFICPGAMKLFGWFGGMPGGMKLTPRLWVGGIIVVVGGTMIVLGLFTRVVAFIASGEMAAAYFMGHFPNGFFPIQNHGETAYLLCFIFLFLWGNGPGAWSLDGMRRRKI